MENHSPEPTTDTPSGDVSASEPQQSPDARDRWRRRAAFVVSLLGGALVWGLSPSLTGKLEPWDAPSVYYGYYFFGIVAAAAGGGLFAGWRFWLPLLGTYCGQVVFCLLFYHPVGAVIIPMPISIALFGSLPSLLGAMIGAVVGELGIVLAVVVRTLFQQHSTTSR